MINESDYLHVDAHVLSSPVLVDIDRDGRAEVFISISYYFDRVEYNDKSKLDFDPDMYEYF
jgi:hypothetical protein